MAHPSPLWTGETRTESTRPPTCAISTSRNSADLAGLSQAPPLSPIEFRLLEEELSPPSTWLLRSSFPASLSTTDATEETSLPCRSTSKPTDLSRSHAPTSKPRDGSLE